MARVGVDNVNDSSNLNIHKQVPEAPFPPSARGARLVRLTGQEHSFALWSPVLLPCLPVTISLDNYERPLFR